MIKILPLLLSFSFLTQPLAIAQQKLSATYYSDYYEGKTMANGQPFSQNSQSVATNSYPFGTRLKICYKNRCVVGIVRDRCGNCGIDLSKRLFKQLTKLKRGRINVNVTRY